MRILKFIISKIVPLDFFSRKYPISIKGVIVLNERIILLKNEREEWELPGGKIEPNETSEKCLVREIEEELNIDIEIQVLMDTWFYNILNKVNVFIITFLCKPINSDTLKIKISVEHKEVGFFSFDEIRRLNMPQGYKNSIYKAFKILDK